MQMVNTFPFPLGSQCLVSCQYLQALESSEASQVCQRARHAKYASMPGIQGIQGLPGKAGSRCASLILAVTKIRIFERSDD